MKKLVGLLLILLVLPTIAFAITWPSRNILEDIRDVRAGNPIWPYDNIRNIFFFVFIPFWGVFIITYGLLSRLRIFPQKRINLLLALIFGMSLLYYGGLTYIVSVLYTISGFFSVIAFFVIFIIGVFLFGRRKEAEWKRQVEDAAGIEKDLTRARKDLKAREDELRIVREDLTDTRSSSRIKQLKQREQDLLADIRNLRSDIVQMKMKGESIRTSLIVNDDDV